MSRAQFMAGLGFLAAGSAADVWELEVREEGEAAQPRGIFFVEHSFAWPNALDKSSARQFSERPPAQRGEALLIVACLLEQRACIRDAGRDLRNCLRDCPIPDL